MRILSSLYSYFLRSSLYTIKGTLLSNLCADKPNVSFNDPRVQNLERIKNRRKGQNKKLPNDFKTYEKMLMLYYFYYSIFSHALLLLLFNILSLFLYSFPSSNGSVGSGIFSGVGGVTTGSVGRGVPNCDSCN